MAPSRFAGVWIAEQRGTVLLPVSVASIGDACASRDGHHRVSVARARGAVAISAIVAEPLVLPGVCMPEPRSVRELRVAVTAADYEEAVAFYRDVLGLPERAAFASPDGRVTILDAGRATLELLDPTHADFVDAAEVGRRVAGHVRLAFEVDDSTAATRALAAAGATVIAEPRRTPWDSMNARLEGPAGLQLTLFQELEG